MYMRILVRFLEHDVSHSLAVTMIGNLFVHLHIVCRSSGIANTITYATGENSAVPANPPTPASPTTTSKGSRRSSRAPAKSLHADISGTVKNLSEASTTLAESLSPASLTATPTELPGQTTSSAPENTRAGTHWRSAYTYTKEHLDAAAFEAQEEAQNTDAFREIANLTCKYDLT